MLFTEQDLSITNAMDILNEATYLSEYESIINPQTIPVKEVSRLGYGVVRFDDVDKLSESYGIDYIDAMYMIAESSDMNPEYLAVAVPEEEIIAYPEIVNELANIVIQPLSEYDDEYQYVAECVNIWLESGNDEYLGLLLEDIVLNEDRHRRKNNEEKAHAFSPKTGRVSKPNFEVISTGKTPKTGTITTPNFEVVNRTDPHVIPHNQEYDSVTPLSLLAAERELHGKTQADLAAERTAHTQTKSELEQAKKSAEERQQTINTLNQNIAKSAAEHETYKNKGLHRAADKLYDAGNWVKNNKVKTAVGVGLGAAAIGGGIYAYKQYKNKPRSVIAKRIAALRGVYKKFMLEAQRNPQKANVFKRIAAKILSVIDKLLGYLQNKADGR